MPVVEAVRSEASQVVAAGDQRLAGGQDRQVVRLSRRRADALGPGKAAAGLGAEARVDGEGNGHGRQQLPALERLAGAVTADATAATGLCRQV